MDRLVRDLDCLLFAEQPLVPALLSRARRARALVACVPNWERLAPDLDWIRDVDLMICPTKSTYALLSDWRRRYGLEFDLACVPWPIDVDRHRFRQRELCERFLFINGWGGCRARRVDGTLCEYRRKGLRAIVEAAILAPELRFVIQTQRSIEMSLPDNVAVLPPSRDNTSIYEVGDVCVQPSCWEGIGLPLIECQAAGMPLVTTDAEPMNEYRPLAVVPAAESEIVSLTPQPFISHLVDPSALARTLRDLNGRQIGEASRRARDFVVKEHSWSVRGPKIWDAIQSSIEDRASRLHRTSSNPIPTKLATSEIAVADPAFLGSTPVSPRRERFYSRLGFRCVGRQKVERVDRWSVGVTTASRADATLDPCLERLTSAGWSDFRLFVDGDLDLPDHLNNDSLTRRKEALGAWPNYYLGLAELVMRDPRAGAYMMLQDDALLSPGAGLRTYLEQFLWPTRGPAIASLFCSSAYTQDQAGWFRFRGVWQWGALAFVFSRQAAERFLTDKWVRKHRLQPGKNGVTNVDGVIGRWARRKRIPVYHPTPSLVQHIGETSTLWQHGGVSGNRQADWFAADEIDFPPVRT